MIEIIIPLMPVPWSAHRGFGKKSFNPRYKEREAFQWYIRKQYRGEPVNLPVSVFYSFEFPIPKSFSKKKVQQALDCSLKHITKPDTTNLVKFTEDCLKGIVIVDDNQVWEGLALKKYAESPRVKININIFEEIIVQ